MNDDRTPVPEADAADDKTDVPEARSILIVDDEPRNRRLLKAMLTHEGYDVILAESGAEALDRVDSTSIDALVLDLMMPGMDGLQVIERLRSDGHIILPIIMVTASGQQERRIDALDAGADDFLTKPVDRVELVTRLRNSLRLKSLHDELRLKNERLAQSEQRARRREQELRASLVDHLPILLFEGHCPPEVPSARPELTWVSSNAEKVVGVSADELKNVKDWLEFVAAEDRPQLVDEFNRIYRGDQHSWSTEFRWISPSGDELWLLGGGGVVERFKDGRTRRMMCFALDVTERRRLADQLREAAKLEAVGELAAGLAHDFNNMLAVIQSYAEFIAKDGSEQISDDASEILDATRRARELTSDLLSFSRNQVVEPSAESLSEVVKGLEGMLARLVGEDITVEISCSPGDPLVVVPVGEIERIIVNLVTNARDALPQGGTITVRTDVEQLDAQDAPRELASGSYVVLEIEDDGEGMDAETRARIFEPFFTTKDTGSGTGLGLATVYGIVRQAGGHVSVDTELGEGTCFRLYFPTADSETLESISAASLESDTTPMDAPGRILVLDDADGLRKAVVRRLRLEGFDADGAASGDEALALVREGDAEIGILISDVVMPKMDGFEAAAAIREVCPELRVIFMSGYANQDDLARARELSEQGIIQKPFEFDELLEAVQQLITGNKSS